MKLHPINHDLKTTLWCGPAALATVTGKPVSECVEALRQTLWDKSKPIKGVTGSMMEKAAPRLGIRLVWKEVKPEYVMTAKGTLEAVYPTLAKWTRENRATFAKLPAIVNVTGHYVTVQGRKFNDNHTKNPVALRRSPHRRARVRRFFVVEPILGLTTAAPAAILPA